MTTGGTPERVTELALSSESLSGSIPAGLGGLSALMTLNLSSNSLTGTIPAELGLLRNLKEVKRAKGWAPVAGGPPAISSGGAPAPEGRAAAQG